MIHSSHLTTASRGSRWALVLAAGDGSRLTGLTRDATGIAVPKQFCSLDGGPSLLRETMQRARRAVAADRVVVVVAEAHRRWWSTQLADHPTRNVVVQPRNRGTAAGILLPLLAIRRRDPGAEVLVLPSDHFVADEAALDGAIRRAFAASEGRPGRVILLGIAPEEADPGLGWIVPERGAGWLERVARFVEKPPRDEAEALLAAGAVWNSFVFVAGAGTLVELIRSRLPGLVRRLERASRSGRVDEVYGSMPSLDFSREVLQAANGSLRVVRVPRCGWSDLGTPERLARRALRLIAPPRVPLSPRPGSAARPVATSH